MAPSAQAAELTPHSLRLSPPHLRIELQPSETYSGEFTVANQSSEPIKFQVYAAPYSVDGTAYNANYDKETTFNQMSRWVSFPRTEFVVTRDEPINVPFNVNVPASIPDGSQYAAIFVHSLSDGAPLETGVNVNVRLAMLILARTPGKTINSGSVVDRQIDFWHTKSPVTTSVNIKNDGNTDFEATARLKISSLFGKELYTSPDVPVMLLPDTTRQVDLNWDNSSPFGLYWLEQEVSIFGEPHNERRLILVLPLLVLLPIIILLLAVIFVILRYIQTKHRRRASLLRRHRNKKLDKSLQKRNR
jgi:hypothetical protein